MTVVSNQLVTSMGELHNFRMMRSPQRKILSKHDQIPTHKIQQGFTHVEPALTDLINILNNQQIINVPTDILYSNHVMNYLSNANENVFRGLQDLDEWLTINLNKPNMSELKNKLQQVFENSLGSNWPTIYNAIGNGIIVSMVSDLNPGKKQYYVRLLLVAGLVESLLQQDTAIQTSDDAYRFLRWNTIVIPANIIVAIKKLEFHRPYVVRSGFADLYTVREEWNRYEAAEIAYIENVLPGENTTRELVNTNETTTTVTVSQEKSQLTEQDNQTTDRFNLQSESKDDVQLATHLDGKVDTSGTYGPTTVNTHIGGSLDFSQDHSAKQAVTQTKENVSRAVTKVEEKITQIRTTTTLVRTTETNKHAIDNSGKDSPVVGIYRWVDKINRIQVIRYPHRYLLEFEVPEPGAWIRWLHKDDNTKLMITQEPVPLTDSGSSSGNTLDASMITTDNYMKIGARYAAAGLDPPPEIDVIIATEIKFELPDEEKKGTVDDNWPSHYGFHYNNNTTLAVPEGYKAHSWRMTVQAERDQRFGQKDSNQNLKFPHGYLSVAVGDSIASGDDGHNNVEIPTWGWTQKTYPDNGYYQMGSITTGNIPISILDHEVYGYLINIEFLCRPLDEKMNKWKNDTYDKIASAYYALKQQYEGERAQKQIQTGISINGDSPERNQEIIKEELKRQVVEMLMGSRFKGYNTSDNLPNDNSGPYNNLPNALKIAPTIQFIEQAFEWENLTYIVYPYYWAFRDEWKDLEPIEGTDPDFDRFLKSGSARVVVPARPMFEADVQLYTEFGIMWGGGSIPAPGDPDYLSIATEIKEMQQGPSDGEKLDAWEVRLPTTLVWLDNKVTSLPKNQNATITDEEVPQTQRI